MPLIELDRAPSSGAVGSNRDASVTPQFVSILNGQGIEPSAEPGRNCISPVPPLPPPPCVGGPPPPCVGGPPEPCYGGPPPCYMGR